MRDYCGIEVRKAGRKTGSPVTHKMVTVWLLGYTKTSTIVACNPSGGLEAPWECC